MVHVSLKRWAHAPALKDPFPGTNFSAPSRFSTVSGPSEGPRRPKLQKPKPLILSRREGAWVRCVCRKGRVLRSAGFSEESRPARRRAPAEPARPRG